MSIDEAIFYTSDWIRLWVYWANGTLTVFERDKDSMIWLMESRDGTIRIVEPFFDFDGPTFTIGFPTTRELYRLNDDNTGNFGSETMTWFFESSPLVSKESTSGMYMIENFAENLEKYQLIIIRVYWHDGDVTIFYRAHDGSWMMRSRTGSFSSVAPTLERDAHPQVVNMRFPGTDSFYHFFPDGSGVLDNEEFYWYYGFTNG